MYTKGSNIKMVVVWVLLAAAVVNVLRMTALGK